MLNSARASRIACSTSSSRLPEGSEPISPRSNPTSLSRRSYWTSMRLSLIQLRPVDTPITSKRFVAGTPSCAARLSIRAVRRQVVGRQRVVEEFHQGRLSVGLRWEDAARDVRQQSVLGVGGGRSAEEDGHRPLACTPQGRPNRGSNTRQESGRGEDPPGVFRRKRGVDEDGQCGRPAWSCRDSNTDETWSANRTAMWTLSTDGQSTAARSLPAADWVSFDHSRTRSGSGRSRRHHVQFGKPSADISSDGPKPDYHSHVVDIGCFDRLEHVMNFQKRAREL